jgi:hypothetical protein
MPVPGDRANVIPTNEEITVTVKSLDDIMSGRGEPASEEANASVATESATPAPAEPTGASRDEQGRFAAKQTDAAVAVPEVPVSAPAPTQQPSGQVPIQALDAERGKRKELEERYDRDMRELRDQLARLSAPPAPTEPPKPPPALWDDPDGYLQHQLTPVQQQMQEMREALQETQAISTHGAAKVQAAKQAAEALFNTPQGAALGRELMAGGNPFDNLVKWHERQTMNAEIGGDLEAYKAKIRQQIMDEIASQQQPQTAPTPQPAPAPNLPTAFAKTPAGGPRGGAEYGGPRPLSEIMGGR